MTDEDKPQHPGDGEDWRKNIPINSTIGILLQQCKFKNLIFFTLSLFTFRILVHCTILRCVSDLLFR